VSGPQIFISHIHEDGIAAAGLEKFLRAKLPSIADGIFVSSNRSHLILGDDWLQKIRSALESCKIVIALLSPESITRPWVNFEAGGAWFHQNKTLIPVCIGDLVPTKLPKPYSTIQSVRLGPLPHGWQMAGSEAPRYLVDSISQILGETDTVEAFSIEDQDLHALNASLHHWLNFLQLRKSAKERGQLSPEE
jgi:hypothetical protein